jgi:hypothetical protein
MDRRALTPLPAGRTALAPALIQLGRPTSPWPAARCAAGFFLPRHAPQSGQRHRGVKCFRSRRLHPLQVPACQQARQELAEESPNGKVRFRCSGRHRHHLGHHGRGIVALSAGTTDDGRHRAGKLVHQSCSAPHVVIAGAAKIGRSTVRTNLRRQSERRERENYALCRHCDIKPWHWLRRCRRWRRQLGDHAVHFDPE